jgi:lipoprotein-anchoring transpeptidase ErfK/SrfK
MKKNFAGIIVLVTLFIPFVFLSAVFGADKKASGKKAIIVNVDEQILQAVENFKIVYEFDVVTGRPGKETETGRYAISKKFKKYTSKTYNVPMPYSMFFSADGKAIHGTEWATVRSYLHTYITESVGSQGCVGLNEEDAKTLFEWAPVGTPIAIIDVPKDD